MEKKIQDELFQKLTDEIKPLIEDGKVESSKLDEVLNRIKENDLKTLTLEEQDKEDKLTKILEAHTNQWKEQQKFNESLAKLGVAPARKGLIGVVPEEELNSIPENLHKDYAFGRHAQVLMNSYLASRGKIVLNEKDSQFLNAINTTLTDAAGRYTLPIERMATLFDDLSESGDFFRETTPVDFGEGEGDTKKFPTVASSGHPNSSIAATAETSAKPIGNFTFGEIDLKLICYPVIVPFSTNFQKFSPLDLATVIRQYSNDWYGGVFDNILYNGDASINGLQDISTTNYAITGMQMSELTVNDLLNVMGGLRSVDMKNAKWCWSPSNWARLFQKLDESGRREFPLNDINGKTLLGFPVLLSDFMQAFVSGASASTDFGYFGNLKKLFVGKYNGLDISFSDQATIVSGETTYNMWQQNMVGYRLEMFVDMDCAFPSRITAIKTAAA